MEVAKVKALKPGILRKPEFTRLTTAAMRPSTAAAMEAPTRISAVVPIGYSLAVSFFNEEIAQSLTDAAVSRFL